MAILPAKPTHQSDNRCSPATLAQKVEIAKEIQNPSAPTDRTGYAGDPATHPDYLRERNK